MGRNSKYYGIRFDRRSQNFGFHMIARSQLIADDRRSVFPYDRRRSQNFLRSAIRDSRSSAIIWKPALNEMYILSRLKVKTYSEGSASHRKKFSCERRRFLRRFLIMEVYGFKIFVFLATCTYKVLAQTGKGNYSVLKEVDKC